MGGAAARGRAGRSGAASVTGRVDCVGDTAGGREAGAEAAAADHPAPGGVAAASARYLFHGWDWHRDRKATGLYDHQADGVATQGSEVRLVEVELTPKTLERYNGICTSHAWRMANEGVTRVDYLCTEDAARTVSREADKWIFRGDRARLVVHPAFDERGVWTDVPDALWDQPAVDAPRELTTRFF
jgi:hypothetical protein